MFRFFLFLLVFSFLGYGSYYLCLRESYKVQASELIEQGKIEQALRVLLAWKQLEPQADSVYLLLGKVYLQKYLKSGLQVDLNLAEGFFLRSDELFSRDPKLHYAWAQLSKIRAGIEITEKGYTDYIFHMRRACQLDPKNYYYYSIYFETLISFLTDLSYLRVPLDHKLYLDEVSYALQGYLSLKKYYRDQYLSLVKAHFDEQEQAAILGGENE